MSPHHSGLPITIPSMSFASIARSLRLSAASCSAVSCSFVMPSLSVFLAA